MIVLLHVLMIYVHNYLRIIQNVKIHYKHDVLAVVKSVKITTIVIKTHVTEKMIMDRLWIT